MAADPRRYVKQKAAFQTAFLTAEQFYQNEGLTKRHEEVLWRSFHTHGKYARIARHAEYVAVAVDQNKNYVASTFMIPLGAKWILEYVMTDPVRHGKGAGSAVMDCVMREAKKRHIEWVILNCDPKKNQGQLPKFYAKFGFKAIA